MFSDMGLNSTGGLSNNSNGMPKHIRPIMDSALVAMAMMQGLTSAIVNPNDLRLMETIKSCDVFKGTLCMQILIWSNLIWRVMVPQQRLGASAIRRFSI